MLDKFYAFWDYDCFQKNCVRNIVHHFYKARISGRFDPTTANHVGGPQAAVRRPAREAVAHSARRAQRAVGVEAALGAGVALALGA